MYGEIYEREMEAEDVKDGVLTKSEELEAKLRVLEQLHLQHRSWEHGFQQLLNFGLSTAQASPLLHTDSQHSLKSHLCEGGLDLCPIASTPLQGLEHESYITNVLASSSPASNETDKEYRTTREAACKKMMQGRKRKRTKVCMNSKEVESQRMTHIAVERNRRKQMNDHLSALRSLMPRSYIQRGDQASIVGAAIEYVKELEQLLHSVQALKQKRICTEEIINSNEILVSPQFIRSRDDKHCSFSHSNELSAENNSAVDIQVTLIETHANVKILCEKQDRQLLAAIASLESLRLTVLHLNITCGNHTVLYSLNLKVEEDCRMTSADEIAGTVRHIFDMIGCSRRE